MKLWDNDGQCSLIFFPYHSVDFRLFQNPRINNEVGLSFSSSSSVLIRPYPFILGRSGKTGHFRSDEPLKDIRYDEKNCDWNKKTISYSTASWWVYKRQNGISWVCLPPLAIWQKWLVQGRVHNIFMNAHDNLLDNWHDRECTINSAIELE